MPFRRLEWSGVGGRRPASTGFVQGPGLKPAWSNRLFDATYGRVARCLETLWDLADGRTKAQKLRPTARHRRHAAFAGDASTTEARRLPTAIEAPGEPATAQIAASALPEPADAAFAANPAPAAAEAAATPKVALWTRLKRKFRNTRFQQPTELNFRPKAPSKTVLTGFCAPKSSQHRRLTPLRRPESSQTQRLAASRRPSPPSHRGAPRTSTCVLSSRIWARGVRHDRSSNPDHAASGRISSRTRRPTRASISTS